MIMKCKLIKSKNNISVLPKFEDFVQEFVMNKPYCLIEDFIKEYFGIMEDGWVLYDNRLYKVSYDQNYIFVGDLLPSKNSLTFDTLRKANIQRLPEFKNSKGKPAHSKSDGSDWSPAQWLQAAIGELGEYANVMKKVERGDLSFEEAKPLIEKELADVMTYLDILAFRVDVDLSKAVQEKFNEVSERVGCSLRIENNEVIRKPDVNKTYGFVLPTYSQAVNYVSPIKEQIQEELAKIKESNQAMLEKRLRTEYKSKAKEIADNWIGTNKISNDTRAKIEDLVEQDLLEIKKSIESESEKVSTIELIVNAALMGVKFSEATKLKVDKLIGEDLKQIKESGCGTSAFENYDYNTKNGELTPKLTNEELKAVKEACRIPKDQVKGLNKTSAFQIIGLFSQVCKEKLNNITYPLEIPRDQIIDVFAFNFQGIDDGKQYRFYSVRELNCPIFNIRQTVCRNWIFEFFSKQLGTKITGMLINGSRETNKLNPGNLIQFYDDRNVLWNFRLVKSSDKNVEVTAT